MTVVRLGPRTVTPKGQAVDPARAAAESAARAGRIVRRLAVEHSLTRLVTLTYRGAGQHNRDDVVKDVQHFVKRLRRRVKVRYVWVLELHPGGHGWHVHMLLDRYVSKGLLGEVWGHGFVDARMIRGPKGEAAKSAGRYAAKYLAKDAQTAQGRQPGQQRYGRSEGLGITEHRCYVGTFVTGFTFVRSIVPRALEWFDCASLPRWTGPPCLVTSW